VWRREEKDDQENPSRVDTKKLSRGRGNRQNRGIEHRIGSNRNLVKEEGEFESCPRAPSFKKG